MAAAHRAHGRDAALVRAHRRRPARPVEHRRADHRAHQGRLADLGVQHARHDQPGRRDRRAAPTRSARSWSSTPPRRRRSCRSTWSALAAPTSWPSPATRWSARPASACSGAGARCSTQLPPFLGGGEMIETVTMERSTYAADPAQVRGRHPADRRGGRPRRRRRLPRPHRHGRRPRARAGDHGVRARGAGDRARADRARPARRRRSAAERSRFELDGVHPHDVAQVLDIARHRGPGRPPLRQAGARAVRRAELDPDVVVPLHDAGGDRRARRGPGIHPLATSSWVERDEPRTWTRSTRRSSWTTTRTRTTRACASPSRPRCTTSTPPAATR